MFFIQVVVILSFVTTTFMEDSYINITEKETTTAPVAPALHNSGWNTYLKDVSTGTQLKKLAKASNNLSAGNYNLINNQIVENQAVKVSIL